MTPESVSSWSVPAISSIQRTNVVIVAITAAILGLFASAASAIGCLLGGAVVIANLWILAALGRLLIGAAGAGISKGAARIGALAIPMKLFIVVGLVYLAFTRAHVDGMGFGIGVLTQMAAIIIETGRASVRTTA
jgi:ATP synthase I subunit